jgi:F-type H+-transporting ATPase subunit b
VEALVNKFFEIWWHIPVIMAMVFVYAFLLDRALFRPVQRVLRERKDRIQESDRLSQRSRDELKSRFNDYEQAVLEAHRKGTHVKEEARTRAYEYRNKVLSEVKAEMDAEMAKADGALKGDVASVKGDLEGQMPAFARMMASKVLGREVAV